jgi:hypothetical protein
MILGMSTSLFTQIHVAISLIGIVAGLMVLVGMTGNKLFPALTSLFLATTALTSVTGFFFPFHGFTPGIVVGILSLFILLVAYMARYGKHLENGWRRTYVITAMFALYLNCFVLVAQLFEHVPSLHVLAPTGTEPPFKIAQLAVLVVFALLTFVADKNFRPFLPFRTAL